MTLLECLASVPDFRRKAGRRYSLSSVLTLCVLSVMSGYHSYREMHTFGQSNQRLLGKYLRLSKGIPSHVSLRKILQGVDFQKLAEAFHGWAIQFVTFDEPQWLAIDGKSLRSTFSEEAHRDFVSLVSVFTHQRGLVLQVDRIHSGKESEIASVEGLLKRLDLKGAIFTLDALHCQKKP